MAFLDNSGDIILDAVLTDLGRELLARGNGDFKITQFALADDEINYALFDITAATGAESTTIRQLPVFEALTANNTALKYKMLNIVRTDHLYMSIMKLNELLVDTRKTSGGYFAVCVDKTTEGNIRTTAGAIAGVMNGANLKDNDNHIRIDQGWDTVEIPYTQTLPADQWERDWVIKIDDRFGQISAPDNKPLLLVGIDWSSNIAAYQASDPGGGASGPAPKHEAVWPIDNILGTTQSLMTIAGPTGMMLNIKIEASQLLQTSYDPFNKFGGTMNSQDLTGVAGIGDLKYIDTSLKVVGGVTNFSMDIPVRFIKSF